MFELASKTQTVCVVFETARESVPSRQTAGVQTTAHHAQCNLVVRPEIHVLAESLVFAE